MAGAKTKKGEVAAKAKAKTKAAKAKQDAAHAREIEEAVRPTLALKKAASSGSPLGEGTKKVREQGRDLKEKAKRYYNT